MGPTVGRAKWVFSSTRERTHERNGNCLFWLILACRRDIFCARGCKRTISRKFSYDRQTDRLVVTMIYRGTNPNHHFSLKWGPCQASQSGGLPGATAEVLDDQYDDAAEQDFTKTVRLSLAGMPCPAPGERQLEDRAALLLHVDHSELGRRSTAVCVCCSLRTTR